MRSRKPLALDGRDVVDQGAVDGDLIGLEVLDDVLGLRDRALFLTTGDDEDDTAAATAGAGGGFGGFEDGVVEGVDLLGNVVGGEIAGPVRGIAERVDVLLRAVIEIDVLAERAGGIGIERLPTGLTSTARGLR